MRAVDDVSLSVARNEIYGLAGELSCGKTTLIKTIAAAVHPPLRVVGGSVTFDFTGRPIDMHTAAAPISQQYAGAISPTSCKAR